MLSKALTHYNEEGSLISADAEQVPLGARSRFTLQIKVTVKGETHMGVLAAVSQSGVPSPAANGLLGATGAAPGGLMSTAGVLALGASSCCSGFARPRAPARLPQIPVTQPPAHLRRRTQVNSAFLRRHLCNPVQAS